MRPEDAADNNELSEVVFSLSLKHRGNSKATCSCNLGLNVLPIVAE